MVLFAFIPSSTEHETFFVLCGETRPTAAEKRWATRFSASVGGLVHPADVACFVLDRKSHVNQRIDRTAPAFDVVRGDKRFDLRT